MKTESTKLSEISQTEKDKYYIISLFMWNLKKDDVKLTRMMVARVEG